MRDSSLLSVVVPAALMALMLGLGLSLQRRDFVRVSSNPRVVALGLAAQLGLLPLLGLGVVRLFGLDPNYALGLVVLTLCPGGALSNAISSFVRADVALSVTLTALSSLITPFSIPLLYSLLSQSWVDGESVLELPIGQTVARLVAVSVLPIVVGMAIRHQLGARARSVEGPVRAVSVLLFVAVVAAIVAHNREALGAGLQRVGAAALALSIAAMILGVGLARLARATPRSAVTVGIEVGMQNAATATFVAATLLQDSAMALVPAVYALVMVPSALLLGLASRQWIVGDRSRVKEGLRMAGPE